MRIRLFCVLCTLIITLSGCGTSSSSGSNPPEEDPITSGVLLATGQTTTYYSDDDGASQRGYTDTNRFVANADGTFTDTATGLIWLQDAGCLSASTWQNALLAVSLLANGTCSLADNSSLGDWRMPNRRELLTVQDYGSHTPAVSAPFTSISFTRYWSSTTAAYSTSNAWVMDFWHGGSGNTSKGFTTLPAVAVRGESTDAPVAVLETGQLSTYADGDDGELRYGKTIPGSRFIDNNDGTVTDNLTGLTWLANAQCSGIDDWEASMEWAAQLQSGMCGLTDNSTPGDWVIPNIRELETLIYHENGRPALDKEHPFGVIPNSYTWSSTTTAYDTTDAWGITLTFGSITEGSKQYSNFTTLPIKK